MAAVCVYYALRLFLVWCTSFQISNLCRLNESHVPLLFLSLVSFDVAVSSVYVGSRT
jgi:hypothetical protein